MSANKSNPGAAAFQQMLAQLRAAFLAELPEKLNHLESLILALEQSSGIDEPFHDLYRSVHSLKGSGGTHGLHIITAICHQQEDLLTATASKGSASKETIGNLLAYVDLLRQAVGEISQGHTAFPLVEQKLAELRQALSAKLYSVLLVDNSKLSTSIYLQILKGFPVRAIVVDDGYLALMRILTEPFDLLISANEIPILNGAALIGALRLSHSKNQAIKTVLITSNAKIVQHRKRNTDADYIIPKDAHIAKNLEATVKTIIGEFAKRGAAPS
jgi:HPt (histidine-containing phosphotransfer) domain-containing protein